MQRITALITLTAFLLVITLPMMPITPVFAHDKVQTCANHDACKGDCHGGACHDKQNTPTDLVMTDMDMDMPDVVEAQVIQPIVNKVALVTPVEGTAKMGCGCGCQHTPDTFPAVLTPHLPSHINFQTTIVSTRSIYQLSEVKITRNTPPNIPPPRTLNILT